MDDTVDLIEEMPASVVKRILRHTDPETRRSVNEILRYPEDSAGSIMTTEFVDLKRDMTVSDAIKRIRRTGSDKETINICYVTDPSRHLLGLVSIRTLVLADEEDIIEDIMETNIISASTMDWDFELTVPGSRKYPTTFLEAELSTFNPSNSLGFSSIKSWSRRIKASRISSYQGRHFADMGTMDHQSCKPRPVQTTLVGEGRSSSSEAASLSFSKNAHNGSAEKNICSFSV